MFELKIYKNDHKQNMCWHLSGLLSLVIRRTHCVLSEVPQTELDQNKCEK